MNEDVNHPCFQIRTFYRQCNGPTCNCAAAVKSGDDVIVFDRCGAVVDKDHAKKTNKDVQIQMYINGELTIGTQVHRIGNSYPRKVCHNTEHLSTGVVIES